MTHINIGSSRPGQSGVIALTGAGLAAVLLATALVLNAALPWQGDSSPAPTSEVVQEMVAARPLEGAASGDGWSVSVADDAGSLVDAVPIVKWIQRQVDLVDGDSGALLASINASSYPMVVTRRSAGELLVSDKSSKPGAAATARLLIFDSTDRLALKAEVQLDPNRDGYTSYWPGMALSADETVLFYVIQSIKTELAQCAGTTAVANMCDRVEIGAVRLDQLRAALSPAEMPEGCQPPPLTISADPAAVFATCGDGRAFEVQIVEGQVSLSELPHIVAPPDHSPFREGRPSAALVTNSVGASSGTLFSNGEYVPRSGASQPARAVPDGQIPLLGGDDVHVLLSGRLLIAFGAAGSVFPQGVAVFDPASGAVEQVIPLDETQALSMAPKASGQGIVVAMRSGVIRDIPFAGTPKESGAGAILPEETSLIP